MIRTFGRLMCRWGRHRWHYWAAKGNQLGRVCRRPDCRIGERLGADGHWHGIGRLRP